MAQFLSDTFTDVDNTALQSHTPDIGGTWGRFVGTSDITIFNNLARLNTIDTVGYTNTATSATADYTVTAFVRTFDATNNNKVGVLGRKVGGAQTFYIAYMFGGASGSRGFRLSKFINGSETVLSTYLFDFISDTFYSVRLDMFGSRIRMFVDGTIRADVTDASIPDAGRAGLYGSVSSNRVQWNDLSCYDIPTKTATDSSIGGDTSAIVRRIKTISDQGTGFDSALIKSKTKNASDSAFGLDVVARFKLIGLDHIDRPVIISIVELDDQ